MMARPQNKLEAEFNRAYKRHCRRLREALTAVDPKWTQAYMAERLGIGEDTYKKYEKAGSIRPLPLHLLGTFAELVGSSADDILARRMPEKRRVAA